MSSVREFFTAEASEYIDRLRSIVNGLNDSAIEPAELHKVTRALRGSAQMAREDRVYRVSMALESIGRALAARSVQWSEDLSERTVATLDDLRTLVQGGEDDAEADRRVETALQRLNVNGGQEARPAQPTAVEDQFRDWAASEVIGIATELEAALQALARDPRDREPLRQIMRRQRALSGSAQLSTIPPVAETLRALEDITRLVVRLDVAVKSEWLDAYRYARDVLTAAGTALRGGNTPTAVPALSRVRTLREELLERYGSGEEAPPPAVAAAQAAAQAQRTVEPPASVTGPASPAAPAVLTNPPQEQPDDIVPIESLLYSREGALRRALELKPDLQRIATPDTREAVEELFDLIGLALK